MSYPFPSASCYDGIHVHHIFSRSSPKYPKDSAKTYGVKESNVIEIRICHPPAFRSIQECRYNTALVELQLGLGAVLFANTQIILLKYLR
ncbi:hypothetical protein ACF0H5_018241 [Mactra antiquata]